MTEDQELQYRMIAADGRVVWFDELEIRLAQAFADQAAVALAATLEDAAT